MRIPEEFFIKPRQPKGIRLYERSRALNPFVKNGKTNFGSPIEGNPKYSSEKKPKWIFHLTSTEISGIFGIMKTPAVFMCWCTVAWQVRLWKFFLSFFVSSNQADIIGRTFFPSYFLVAAAASEIHGSVVTA